MISFVKDIKYKLNGTNRRHIKFSVMLYASDMLRMFRTVLSKIKLDVKEESIVRDMGHIATVTMPRFIKRCNEALATTFHKTRYVKAVIKKHIQPVCYSVFVAYFNKLNKSETLSILGSSQNDCLLYSSRRNAANDIWRQFERGLYLIVSS